MSTLTGLNVRMACTTVAALAVSSLWAYVVPDPWRAVALPLSALIFYVGLVFTVRWVNRREPRDG